jgi:hypothetical protein
MMTSVSRAAAMRGASIIAGINVLVASGFSLAGLVSPQSVLPGAGTPGRASQVFALYAAARTIPLALFALVAIYNDRESNFRSVATAREAPRPYGYPIFVYIMHIAASGRSAAMNLVDPSAGKIGKRR